jgi:hypothetical protein
LKLLFAHMTLLPIYLFSLSLKHKRD